MQFSNTNLKNLYEKISSIIEFGRIIPHLQPILTIGLRWFFDL